MRDPRPVLHRAAWCAVLVGMLAAMAEAGGTDPAPAVNLGLTAAGQNGYT